MGASFLTPKSGDRCQIRPRSAPERMYGSWDMVCDRCNCYFSFWAVFCPFTPLTAQKFKILKKWKKTLEISSFYKSVPKIMTRWCTVPEICCAMDVRTDRKSDIQRWVHHLKNARENKNTKFIADHFMYEILPCMTSEKEKVLSLEWIL